MNDIVIENQPILSKLLNKINNSLTMSQAYMLVGNNKEELIKNNLPILTLESKKPVKYFDIIGFSLQYELAYPTMLEMIELSGL